MIGNAGSQDLKPVEYPTPDAVIQFFSQKHPSLRTVADMGKPLALPHRSFEALVSPQSLFFSSLDKMMPLQKASCWDHVFTCFPAGGIFEGMLQAAHELRNPIQAYRGVCRYVLQSLSGNQHTACPDVSRHSLYQAKGNHRECDAGFLENALVRAAPGELQGVALEATLEVAAAAPADFAGGFRGKASWLQGFLSHVNPTG